jgi:ATP-dependent DNA helicase RecG
MIRDLDAILLNGEGYTVEFKVSPDKSLAQEVCAFANASGGRIFIGISDDGKVIGTDTSNASRARIQDTVNQIEPRLPVNITVHENIIIINVPQGKDKPYSCSRGFFMRSGPNSQKLERNDIIEFFQSEGQIRYDSIVQDNLAVDDNFDEKAYKEFLQMADISEVIPRNAILKNLGCIEILDGKAVYTNAGALFFRNNSEDMVYQHATVVCGLYKGTDKAYILDVKEFSNGIVSNIDEAVLFLKRHLNLSYDINGIRRKNILEIPESALRESVINAVCHRNYFEKGARVMVEIFDDRVEITNPGGLPKGITPENFGTLSIARNPVIASMLHRVNYIERMGTGIVRIRDAMAASGLPEPVFKPEGFFKVILKRNIYDVGKDVGKVGKDVVKESAAFQMNLADYENRILHAMSENCTITIFELSQMLNITERHIERLIKKLRENGMIERKGGRKIGYWEVKI